jgi:hypothetical protein
MIRRGIVWLLAALLAVLVALFIVYMPPSALETLKPVPAHAQIVYRSKTPGWFLSFFSDLSICPAEAGPLAWRLRPADAECAADKVPSAALSKAARILNESPLTVATVSLGGRSRRDTWVAVSAIGPYSVLFRWKLMLFRPEFIQPVRSYGCWTVWKYSTPSVPSWAHVRFALTDGLLICSISDDPHDIYYLLDTLDGRRPSLADRKATYEN